MQNLKLTLLALVMGLLALPASGQALSENFDGPTFPPAGWAVFDNGVGTNVSWTQDPGSFQGAGAAFIDYDCSVSANSEDWLVSPLVPITANNRILSFFHRQPDPADYNSLYIIRVSTTSQTNTASFTDLDTIFEAQVPQNYGLYTLDLNAYVGQSIYLGLVHIQDCGDDWYVDELKIEGNCPPPSSFQFVSSTTTTADFTMNSPDGPAQISIGAVGAPPMPTTGPLTGSNYTATGLQPSSTYDAYIRTQCPSDPPIMIAGVFDGPLPGGHPKGVELYVIDSIADLSRYGVSSANNGGGSTSPNPEFVFPAVSALPGSYIYVTSDSVDFTSYFGFSTPYESNAMLINGDDAVELFQDSVVVDVFGDVNTDGTGEPWEYLDGWAIRMNGQSPNGGNFVDSLWIYSGTNVLDGCTSNATCGSTVPLGTFIGSSSNNSAWAGPITFNTQCAPVPGDSAFDPIVIPSMISYQDTGNTGLCYTDQGGTPSADVWYQLVLDPCADSLFVSLCGSQYDTFLAILDNGFNVIDTNDDDGPDCSGVQSSLHVPVTGGDTVYIVVEGFSTNTGIYFMDVNQFLGSASAAFSYTDSTYCQSDSNPVPTISGGMGGTFTSTGGISLDPATGEILLSATTPGTYNIVYSTAGACSASDSTQVTVLQAEDASFSYPMDSICKSDSINPIPTITTPGGTFNAVLGASANPATGEIDLSSAFPGTYTITYMTAGACPGTDSVNISILQDEDGSFAYAADTACVGMGTLAIASIATPGGSFIASAPGLVFSNVNGDIDLVTSMPGTYTVTYFTGGLCPGTGTYTVVLEDCSNSILDALNQQFQVFPNPSAGTFNITNLGLDMDASLMVHDVMGKVIYESPATLNQGIRHTVELPAVSDGTYFLRISGAEGTARYKLFIEQN